MIRMKKINRYNYEQKYKFTWTISLFLYNWGTNLEKYFLDLLKLFFNGEIWHDMLACWENSSLMTLRDL
jgi:hypothetical protein